MIYYKSILTGKYVSENFVKRLKDIYGDDIFQSYLLCSILDPISPPTVEECIKSNSINVAVIRYREIHPECSWDEAYKHVKKIKRDMFRKQTVNKKEGEHRE